LAAASLAPALAQNHKTTKKAAPAKPAQQAAQPNKPEFIYSPWTKVCEKSRATNNKKVCMVASNGRLVNGMPVVGAQIIEPEGGKKLFRVMIPLPVHVQNGTRALVDGQELARAPFVICAPQVGCAADYAADDATIAKLKKGKSIVVQAFNINNTVVSLPVPLTDFAKAYDGPPIDPKALQAQQHKLQQELQKKAEEARKKLQAQKPAWPEPKKEPKKK